MRNAVDLESRDEAGDLDARLAQRLATLRAQAGWSLDDLSTRTGISRATLSRLERGETSATTQLLSRLCTAYQLTMSRLLADVENAPQRLLRAADQPHWRDPTNGFTRHMRSPPLAGFASELIEVELPVGVRLAYDQPLLPGQEHHLHLLQGQLSLSLAGTDHTLAAGDTMSFKSAGATVFANIGSETARYYLVLTTPR
jgi:transcriptional regulator with XRE-family HTH domain